MSSIHQKTSVEEPALLSSQQKASSSMSALQSPQKHQALSKGLNVSCSPQKLELCAKPSSSDLPASREKVTTGAFGELDWKAGYDENCSVAVSACFDMASFLAHQPILFTCVPGAPSYIVI